VIRYAFRVHALIAATILACAGGESPSDSAAAGDSGATPAEHRHPAPHGGTLVELGDELAHLEVVLDSSSGMLTVYVLDGEAEGALRPANDALEIDVELASEPGNADARRPLGTLRLAGVANPLTGETAGATSQFAVRHAAFRGAGRLTGTVRSVEVLGHTFRDLAFTYPDTAAPDGA
jgi:hypothetical protein